CQLQTRSAEEFPPFDKGGRGDLSAAVTKDQSPLDPPFSKGEVGVAPWSVVSVERRCCFLRAYRLTLRTNCAASNRRVEAPSKLQRPHRVDPQRRQNQR